ncbi:MAG: energy-coupling factor transporter transmembrane protein EcfT [Oscillospiraceae bacterium]|jgi:energy-coupling factor transport system permease protein|nr:energy-coupling factor transporter transmembrane protein EcfT [Oscillospiraceae bacterium]
MRNKQTDPRVVFLFVLLLSSGAALTRQALPMIPLLCSAALAAVLAKAPFGQLLRRLRGLWATILAVAALQALLSGDLARGLLAGACVLERLLILLLAGALLAGYPGHVLVQAMLQLRAPYQLAYMVSLGLRFFPQFSESFRDSLAALQLRGVEPRRLKPRARLKLYTYLLLPTIVSGVNGARKLAMAMELRGFGAYPRRSAYAPLHMRRGDWLAFAGVLLWAAGMAVLVIFVGINYPIG